MSYLKRAWAQIHLDRLGHNLEILSNSVDTQVCCVVKANAYGHDDGTIAGYLERHGISFFAVSNIREAITLREHGVSGEILILGHTPCEHARELSDYDIIQTAVSRDYARKLSDEAVRCKVTVKIHLAVDTGMGRIGEPADKALEAAIDIAGMKGVELDGIFTHFAAADSYDDDDILYTRLQKDLFFKTADEIREHMPLRHAHCLNSAGSILHFDKRSTLARFGILLYGLTPDRSLDLGLDLVPVMDLKAAVSYVKTVPAGKSISYGRTYTTSRETVIATVPIGYADGYPRSLSNKGYVIINGRRAPIVGRVCMDQLMCDVTDIPDVCEGTTVTLIGSDGNERITADDIAALTDTIGYEIVCGISKRIPRVITQNGKITAVREYY